MLRQFPRIFLWHVVRHLQRHRLLAALNVLSVALGVAVYLAIQIANHSAHRSFAAGIDLVAGKAQLEVRGDVDETLWPVLARQPGVKAVTGLVEGKMTFPDWPGEYLQVLGVDLFSGEPFRTFELNKQGSAPPLEQWMGEGGQIAVQTSFATRHGLQLGDHLRVLVNSEVKTATVAAFLDSRDEAAAMPANFAVMDIGWAQELFGRQGHLSALQLLLDDSNQAATVAAQLDRLLPPNLHAEAPRQRSYQIESMLAAFQLNLTALSLVSLLVGVFLVYNTISASVARRRVEIGILRSMGATRWEVRGLFLGEAAVFGFLGVAVGMVGGVLLARVLTGAVAKTVTSLYVLLSIDRTWLDPWQFAIAAFFGLATVIVGAWLPAGEAARVDPVHALSLGAHAEGAVTRMPRHAWLGIGVLVIALLAGWRALHGGYPAWSFAAAFCVLTAFALFAPIVTWSFGLLAARTRRAGVVWQLAAGHLRQSIHRNAVTVAALAAAIAMTVGLMVMIFSFRTSVDAWIHHGIVADLFIAPASNEVIGLEAAVPPAAIEWLRARPEVRAVDTFRELECSFEVGGGRSETAKLAILQGEYRHNLTFNGGDDERKMARVFHDSCVAVTEPFARKFGVRAGDHLKLITPRGPADFEIAGVYADYTRDQGVMLMARASFEQWWDDPRVQSLAVYLRPAAASEPLAEAFRQRFSGAGEFAIYSNRSLRQRILSIFDQTFAVTYVLRTVAILVAIAGIFLSVTTLAAEREREIGVFRAVGASRGQVQRLLMTEAGMLGAIATGLGLASGLLLAMVLTWVVNPAFFGWTITLRLPWSGLLATPLWIIPAALLAAWYPAHRASQNAIATAVREE
ncbi:MAG: FtsX-like permease family protein [Chthoniobacter sp.]|nr:FtsX-like permease family protein [Chthoniobacter sp.]